MDRSLPTCRLWSSQIGDLKFHVWLLRDLPILAPCFYFKQVVPVSTVLSVLVSPISFCKKKQTWFPSFVSKHRWIRGEEPTHCPCEAKGVQTWLNLWPGDVSLQPLLGLLGETRFSCMRIFYTNMSRVHSASGWLLEWYVCLPLGGSAVSPTIYKAFSHFSHGMNKYIALHDHKP